MMNHKVMPAKAPKNDGHNLPTANNPDRLFTSTQLRTWLGDISEMTLWRYERDPELGFPKPIRIKRRKYWRCSDISAFERAHGRR